MGHFYAFKGIFIRAMYRMGNLVWGSALYRSLFGGYYLFIYLFIYFLFLFIYLFIYLFISIIIIFFWGGG